MLLFFISSLPFPPPLEGSDHLDATPQQARRSPWFDKWGRGAEEEESGRTSGCKRNIQRMGRWGGLHVVPTKQLSLRMGRRTRRIDLVQMLWRRRRRVADE